MSQRSGVSEEERERVATMLVRHMVFKHYGQPRVPVKREELVEIVQGEYPNSKGLASQVIPIAARMCRELLGFEMVEVGSGLPASELLQQQQDQDLDSQLSQAQAQSTALASGKIFILQSTVKRELLQQYVATDDLTQDMSLRLIVCTLIQSSGGSVTEENLWTLLRPLGIRRNSTQHPVFGNIADTFLQMAKEKFIVLKKGQGEDGSEASCYELGPSATAGIGRKVLKQYFERTLYPFEEAGSVESWISFFNACPTHCQFLDGERVS